MAGGQNQPVIMWFRRDLRLADNPALSAAVASGHPVICLYIHDTGTKNLRPDGGASLWWLDNSLKALSADMEKIGGQLTLRRGESMPALMRIIEETDAAEIYWNRRYGAAERELDSQVKTELTDQGIHVESFNGSLLTEPWTIKTGSGGHYRVFTPYWRAVQASFVAPKRLSPPKALTAPDVGSEDLNNWNLHPTCPDWSSEFNPMWAPGEKGGLKRLKAFLSAPVSAYKDQRNRPDIETGTSGLSPHLRFGEISPVTIWRAVMARIESGEADQENAMVFLSEIAWREFSHVLLFHYPDLAEQNYNPHFEHMPWSADVRALKAWQQGQTGCPIVDAGMRQLWATGWMHNRVRMIVASFLTKHLMIHWTEGEKWFWDTLVDACPAANAASWQWTAGSGADAAPYFRVFNPITQGEKFDETGAYVKRWCPELSHLPRKFLYSPWTASEVILQKAGIILGETYPHPIIDHKEGRARALSAYETMKERRDAA